MSKSHTMIFPYSSLSSLSFSDHNLSQLQLQLLAAHGSMSMPTGGRCGGKGFDIFSPLTKSERARLFRGMQPESGLKCRRCDSTNTKFCYFNNYSITQPRHFCRSCRRYWTDGGALRNRNVPVGPRRVQPPRQAKRTRKPKAGHRRSGGRNMHTNQAHAVE